MSNKLNLELKQGEDFYRLVRVKDESGTLADLTGYSFSGQIRAKFTAELYLTFSFSLKNQTTNPGEVEMTLSRSFSLLKKISTRLNYFYDVEMNSGSIVTRIMQGNISIDPEVTK